MDAGDTVLMEDVADSSILEAVEAGQPPMPPGTTRYGLESERGRSSRPAPLHKAAAKTAARKPTAGTGVAWWAVVVAALLVTVGGAYGWRSHVEAKKAQPSKEDIITEMAEPASAPASNGASDGPKVPALAAASDAASEAVGAAVAASDAASVAAPAFVAASGPRAASRVAQRRKAAAVAVAPPPAPEPAPPPPAPEPAPPPPPPPKPAAPVRLCEGESVLTRSMCLRDQCRKSANAVLPVCVEFRRQMEPLENRQLAN